MLSFHSERFTIDQLPGRQSNRPFAANTFSKLLSVFSPFHDLYKSRRQSTGNVAFLHVYGSFSSDDTSLIRGMLRNFAHPALLEVTP